MIEYEIISLDGMCAAAREFPPMGGRGWCYRGQADLNWDLLPKAGRVDFYNPTWEEDRKNNPNYPPHDLGRFREWKKKAIAFCPNLPPNDFDCLAYAQHFGLATRLLDWTSNPLVALYFAVCDLLDRDGAVYIFMGELIVKPEEISIADVPCIAMFFPPPIHQRVLAQGSLFTVHPVPSEPMKPGPLKGLETEFSKVTENLVRLKIPKEVKPALRDDLRDFGVDETLIFPDLEGLSKLMNWITYRGVTAAKRPKGDEKDRKGFTRLLPSVPEHP